ncbi:MAG: hypothetical protein HQ556_11620 [Candidatus Marinimicrobia bacterium]|nr:hypothetical protein [Candidatus Neomarinimicrobiota bacterium]
MTKVKHIVGYCLTIIITAAVTLYLGWGYFLTTHELVADSHANANLLTINYLLEEDYPKALEIQIIDLEGSLSELYGLEIYDGEPIKYQFYMQNIATLDSTYPGHLSGILQRDTKIK